MPVIDELKEKKMKMIVGRIQNLPTPPIVFTQITKVINDPNTSAYDLAKIIAEDPALTAKILKLTNSSFYGIPRSITNVKQAIVILGMEAVKSLVISASVFEMFSGKNKIDGDYLADFWKHSLQTAFTSRIITRLTEFPAFLEAEMSFSAGLLHDIGKLVIMTDMSKEHAEVKEHLSRDTKLAEFEAENAVMEFSHADIGSFLAAKWNLPEPICNAIRNHHNFEVVNAQPEAGLIHLANHMAHRANMEEEEILPNMSPLNELVWQTLGLDLSQRKKLLSRLGEEYGKAETFLKMAQGLD